MANAGQARVNDRRSEAWSEDEMGTVEGAEGRYGRVAVGL